jgi:hypothetical protein
MEVATTDMNVVDRECEVFCRYLVGQAPNGYVKQKYRAAHQIGALRSGPEQVPDGFLVKAASIAPWSAKIIDTYTRFFRPSSTVRKKLIVLLAILETCAPAHVYLDCVDSPSIPLLFLRLVQRCITFALVVLIGMFVIFPVELTLRGNVKRTASRLARNG